MRYLKFNINSTSLNDEEYSLDDDIFVYVDNKRQPFTGIGILNKNCFNFYLNGYCIKYLVKNKSKKLLEKEFNKAVKEHIFK